MNWIALAEILLQLFGPVLEAWLKKVIARAGPELPAYPPATAAAVHTWFDAVRAKTTWREWIFFARRRLAALELIALKHAWEVEAAGQYGAAPPVLDPKDAEDLAAV